MGGVKESSKAITWAGLLETVHLPDKGIKKSHSPEQRQKVEGVNMAEQGHQQARSRKPLTY